MAKKSKDRDNADSATARKREKSRLSLTLPLARARKLAGDLYEAAGLALWAEAIESSDEPKKAALIHLQDSICDAADFLRHAKATNPRHLQLYWVSSGEGGPPRFVTAANEAQALAIWRETCKEEAAGRRPQVRLVPTLAPAPGPHD
ncbi:MAG TPA: hypothetical protein VMU18_05310 [Rhodoblastus sp.]|nr:hypothetical protein [Rhodoblastus sp.]